MISETQRQRVARYQAQRTWYLQERRYRLEGHPVADTSSSMLDSALPRMVRPLPLGLLLLAYLFSIAQLVTGSERAAELAFWMVATGIAGLLVVTPLIIAEWWSIPSCTSARRLGAWHVLGNLAVAALFGSSWLIHRGDITQPAIIASLLAFTGAGMALITGWLGGELADRVGEVRDRPAASHRVGTTSRTRDKRRFVTQEPAFDRMLVPAASATAEAGD